MQSSPHIDENERGKAMIPYGYAGRILRINLSNGTLSDENVDSDFQKKFIGGAGFGARYLYQENPDNIE